MKKRPVKKKEQAETSYPKGSSLPASLDITIVVVSI
jgi:hypothetical protein